MTTPLSRLQHDLSLAPGIPDSYRLFGEGPTVSTYGDLREVVGAYQASDALADLQWAAGAKAGYRVGYRDGSRPDGCPPEPGEETLATLTESRAREALAAMSAVPPSQGTEPDMRKVVEALGFEPDNHHNALKCPYCNPDGLAPAQPHPDVTGLARNAQAWIARVLELEEAGTCRSDVLTVARSDRDRALIALGRQALAAYEARP